MSLLSFAKKITATQEKKPAVKKATSKKTASKKITTEKVIKEVKQPVVMVSQASAIGLIPLVTEKSVASHADSNTVMFRVIPTASKGQISAAVLERFKVRPVKVRTIQMNPKNRRRGQTEGRTNNWKKAYVQLPAGSSIDFAS